MKTVVVASASRVVVLEHEPPLVALAGVTVLKTVDVLAAATSTAPLLPTVALT